MSGAPQIKLFMEKAEKLLDKERPSDAEDALQDAITLLLQSEPSDELVQAYRRLADVVERQDRPDEAGALRSVARAIEGVLAVKGSYRY